MWEADIRLISAKSQFKCGYQQVAYPPHFAVVHNKPKNSKLKDLNHEKIAIVALLSACVATPVSADNSGFYGAMDLGSASLSNAVDGFRPATSFPNPLAARIAGGYNFSSMFAVETGYARFGGSTIVTAAPGMANTNQTLSPSSVYCSAIGTYPINETFSLFGKLGLANSRIAYSYTDALGNSSSQVGSNTNLMYGIGGQYNVNSKWGIRAQYENFGKVLVGIGTNLGENIGLKMVSIGGVYNF